MKNFISINPENQTFFETKTGKKYIPAGINWFPRGTGWAPQLWKLFDESWFERDFSRIRDLSMNTIRVFLSAIDLMPEEMTVSKIALAKCETMLNYAKDYGLRVIFSGPNWWEGIPEWAKPLVKDHGYFENDRFLKSLENFYHVFSSAFYDHEGLFGYDLFNEPMINYAPSEDDLTSPEKHYAYQKKRQKTSYDFIKLCRTTIKKRDKNHPVSVGSHQWTVPFCGQHPSQYFCFDPHAVSDLLDYVSLHWYPYLDKDIIEGDSETFEYNAAFLLGAMKYMDIGKPVVLEEYGLYGGGPARLGTRQYAPLSQKTQADWTIDVAMKRGYKYCGGWLNWGFDDHSDCGDPTRYQGFYDDDINPKELAKRFPDGLRDTLILLDSYKKDVPSDTLTVNLAETVISGEGMTALRDTVIEKIRSGEDFKFNVII